LKRELGLPLCFGSFKGWIHPSYNHPSFLEEISDCHQLLRQPQCQILHKARNRVGIVRLKNKDEETEVVIKEFKTQGVNKLKSLFLPTKALKAWKGAMILVEKGIDTPFPIACLEKRKGGFLDQSFYLAEKINEVEEIRTLFLNSSQEKLRPLLITLARCLSHCHRKGVLHRDLSDGNILVKEDEEGKFRFYFIDTNRVRFPKKIGRLRRIKHLIRLGIPPSFQPFFLKQYLGNIRVSKPLWLWYRMNKIIYTGYVAFKKKIRLKQIARKLKIQ